MHLRFVATPRWTAALPRPGLRSPSMLSVAVMPVDETPPNSEREQTDESLRVEREKADHALMAELTILDETADAVISKARARADEVLAAARTKTDGQSGTGAPGAK